MSSHILFGDFDEGATLEWIRKNRAKLAGTALIMAALFAILLRNETLSFTEFGISLARFNFFALAIGLFWLVSQVLFMILRLWFLLEKPGAPGFPTVAYAISVGHAVNTFLPATAGNVLKAILLTRDPTNRSYTVMKGTGTLIADRLVDILSLLVLVLISGAYRVTNVRMPKPPDSWPFIATAILGLSALAVWWALRRRTSAVVRWLTEIRSGLTGLLRPGVGVSFLFSLASWSSEALCASALASYQGLSIDFGQSMFVLLVLNLAVAIPVSVASLGTFEASVVFALTTLGLSTASALAVASVHHLLQYAAISLCALVTTIFYRRLRPQAVPVYLRTSV